MAGRRNLSCAGKEVLLKSIVQVIRAYVMQYFLLPKRICIKLNSMMAAFWWGKNWDSKGIHCENGLLCVTIRCLVVRGLGIFPFLIKFIGKTKLEGFESSRFPVGVFSRKSIFPIPYASLYTFSISLPLDTFLH